MWFFYFICFLCGEFLYSKYAIHATVYTQSLFRRRKNDAIKRIHSHSIGISPFLFDVGFIIPFAFLEIEFIMSSFQFWIVLCFARMFFLYHFPLFNGLSFSFALKGINQLMIMFKHEKMRPQYFLMPLFSHSHTLSPSPSHISRMCEKLFLHSLFLCVWLAFGIFAAITYATHSIRVTIIIGCSTRSARFHLTFRLIFFIFSSVFSLSFCTSINAVPWWWPQNYTQIERWYERINTAQSHIYLVCVWVAGREEEKEKGRKRE